MAKPQAEPTWPDLLGSSDWSGLLDPLDISLRHFILRCGDFCQVTYDSFDNEPNSKYCGSCRYGKATLFQRAMLESASDYQVVSYLYATARVSLPEAFLLHSLSRESWDRESNWIGYIAVTSDEKSKSLGRREIYVVWRGTTRNYEWIDVLGAELESVEPLLKESVKDTTKKSNNSSTNTDSDEKVVKAMQGWVTIYTSDDPKSPFTKLSARTQLQTKIKELVRERYRDETLSITITGHSLGASLAVLSGFDLVENGVTEIPVSAILFGCPQVGNEALKERIQSHSNLKILHVRNTIDLIPHYPGTLLGYAYIGTELVIDTRKSTSLKESMNPSDWHNLQAMLHVVAGWNGERGEFELRVKRSVALVNKSCDFLKVELSVPGSWWVEKNKGMVRSDDGEWFLPKPADEDLPVPEF